MSATADNSRAAFKAVTALMWLALPVAWLRFEQAREQLQARMVTHFDLAGRPNGWMSPNQFLAFNLGLTLVLLTLFTIVLVAMLWRTRKLDLSNWAVLGLFYTIVVVESFISDSVLRYNLSRTALPVAAVVSAALASVFVFTAVYLCARRGEELPGSPVITEETHGSRLFAFVFVIPAAAELVSAAVVPIIGVRLVLAVSALALLGAAAFAWDGFQYRFTPAGIEIRTLGFRLRSIPAADIQNYVADRWSALGGYGIRGLGDRRAYVWGKSGVRIKTSEGEVFLGHAEPAKIVRDLDLVTGVRL